MGGKRKCQSCNSSINDKYEELKCTTCAGFFHYRCLGFTPASYRNFSSELRSKYRCNSCVFQGLSDTLPPKCDKISQDSNSAGISMDHGTPSSLDTGDVLSSYSAQAAIDETGNTMLPLTSSASRLASGENHGLSLIELSRELDVKLNPIKTELSSLHDLIKFISDDYDTVKRDLSDSKAEHLKLKKQVVQIEADNLELRKQLEDLQSTLSDLQYTVTANMLEIRGLPDSNSGQLSDWLPKLATILNIPYEESHFTSIEEKNLRNSKVVILTFVKVSLREAWLSAIRKRKGLKASDLDKKFPGVQIYLNECLPHYKKMILFQLKNLKQQKKVLAYWVRNGNIFARKDTESNPMLVKSVIALENF